MEGGDQSTDPPPNPNELSRLTRDKDYYFDDGSCVFLVENVLFNVHRSMLSRDGSSFGTMFSLPQAGTHEGRSDDHPIVLNGETAVEFRHFLCALYALPPQLQSLTSPTGANLTVLISIARVSNKYAFRSLESWALEAIQDYVTRKPSPILSSIPPPHSYVYSASDTADIPSSATSTTAQLTRLIRLAQLCGHTPLLNTTIHILRELMQNSLQYAYLAMTLSDELGLESLRGAAYLEVMHKAQLVRPLELDIWLNAPSPPPSTTTSSTSITHTAGLNNLAVLANTLAPLSSSSSSSSHPNPTTPLHPPTARLTPLPLTPTQRLRLLTGYHRLSHTWDLLRTTPPPIDHAPTCSSSTWHQHGCTQAWNEFWKEKTSKSDAVVTLGCADVLGKLRAVMKEFEKWGSAAYMHNDCRVGARRRMGEVVGVVERGLGACFECEEGSGV